MEHEGSGYVYDQANPTDDEHQAAVDFGRMVVEETLYSLPYDPAGNHPEAQSIESRRQYVCALIAECALDGLGTAGDPHSQQGQRDGCGVSEHVACVSQQGRAVGGDTSHHLDNHEAADQDKSDDQAAAAGLAQFSGVIVPGVVVSGVVMTRMIVVVLVVVSGVSIVVVVGIMVVPGVCVVVVASVVVPGVVLAVVPGVSVVVVSGVSIMVVPGVCRPPLPGSSCRLYASVI